LCGPFAARGAKGEAEYLSRWLGGAGERSTVGKQERREAGATWERGYQRKQKGKGTLVDLMKKNVVGVTIDLILLALGGKILSFNRCLVLLVYWF